MCDTQYLLNSSKITAIVRVTLEIGSKILDISDKFKSLLLQVQVKKHSSPGNGTRPGG
jgi:hypothetical protein